MMTTAKTTVTDSILAIDLGKYKSVACLYFSADDQHFFSFVTSRAEIARLYAASYASSHALPWAECVSIGPKA